MKKKSRKLRRAVGWALVILGLLLTSTTEAHSWHPVTTPGMGTPAITTPDVAASTGPPKIGQVLDLERVYTQTGRATTTAVHPGQPTMLSVQLQGLTGIMPPGSCGAPGSVLPFCVAGTLSITFPNGVHVVPEQSVVLNKCIAGYHHHRTYFIPETAGTTVTLPTLYPIYHQPYGVCASESASWELLASKPGNYVIGWSFAALTTGGATGTRTGSVTLTVTGAPVSSAGYTVDQGPYGQSHFYFCLQNANPAATPGTLSSTNVQMAIPSAIASAGSQGTVRQGMYCVRVPGPQASGYVTYPEAGRQPGAISVVTYWSQPMVATDTPGGVGGGGGSAYNGTTTWVDPVIIHPWWLLSVLGAIILLSGRRRKRMVDPIIDL